MTVLVAPATLLAVVERRVFWGSKEIATGLASLAMTRGGRKPRNDGAGRGILAMTHEERILAMTVLVAPATLLAVVGRRVFWGSDEIATGLASLAMTRGGGKPRNDARGGKSRNDARGGKSRNDGASSTCNAFGCGGEEGVLRSDEIATGLASLAMTHEERILAMTHEERILAMTHEERILAMTVLVAPATLLAVVERRVCLGARRNS